MKTSPNFVITAIMVLVFSIIGIVNEYIIRKTKITKSCIR
jgi:hypothetical protein